MLRRCVAEFLGTFAIVFFGCGAIATLASHGVAGHLAINAVFGLTVAFAIYALGHVSAAHFNPAVTVAFAAGRHFPWREVPGYIIAQVLGAVAASGLHAAFFADQAREVSFGATLPALDLARTLAVEVVMTFFLMLVIVSVATDKRANPAIPGIAIGMTVAVCGLFAGPLTGSSLNPARSLAPSLFAGGTALSTVWVYLVGPVIGACLAAWTYAYVRVNQEVGGPSTPA